MRMASCLLVACLTTLCLAATEAEAEKEIVQNWLYAEVEGRGPSQWSATNAACGGSQQSPIALSGMTATPTELLGFPIIVYGNLTEYKLTNTQTAVILETVESDPTHVVEETSEHGHGEAEYSHHLLDVNYDEKPYRLDRIEFHSPAEHIIDGATADLEAVFYHTATDATEGPAHLAISVLFDSSPNTRNFVLAKVLPGAPPVPAGSFSNYYSDPEAHPISPASYPYFVTFSPDDLLPASRNAYFYEGSLTQPPCTEAVTRIVLEQRGLVGADQLDDFRDRQMRFADELAFLQGAYPGQVDAGPFADAWGNARPVQEQGAREVFFYLDLNEPNSGDSEHHVAIASMMIGIVALLSVAINYLIARREKFAGPN
ncbi:Carbonate dehydratase, eukaryotic-type [Diplonema papillatum]|nr:Carbonate dehydratase, eukaryotic-type [Diplonema papillatum]